jgi:hypothetical protein
MSRGLNVFIHCCFVFITSLNKASVHTWHSLMFTARTVHAKHGIDMWNSRATQINKHTSKISNESQFYWFASLFEYVWLFFCMLRAKQVYPIEFRLKSSGILSTDWKNNSVKESSKKKQNLDNMGEKECNSWRVRGSLLLWKSNKYYICASVCLRACMCVPGRVGVCMRRRACSLSNPTCKAFAPYCDVICGPSVSTTFSTLSNKRCNFRKKAVVLKMCFFHFIYNFCLKYFSF